MDKFFCKYYNKKQGENEFRLDILHKEFCYKSGRKKNEEEKKSFGIAARDYFDI